MNKHITLKSFQFYLKFRLPITNCVIEQIYNLCFVWLKCLIFQKKKKKIIIRDQIWNVNTFRYLGWCGKVIQKWTQQALYCEKLIWSFELSHVSSSFCENVKRTTKLHETIGWRLNKIKIKIKIFFCFIYYLLQWPFSNVSK